MSKAKKYLNLAFNILFVVIALRLAWQYYSQWQFGNEHEGKIFSSFQALNFDGHGITVPSSFGQKSVVLFWATWCGPCRLELGRLKTSVDEEGLKLENFYAVSVGEEPTVVRKFVAERGLEKVPVFFDPDARAFDSLPYQATPTLVFIEADGTIAAVKTGLSLFLVSSIKDFLKT